MHPEIHVGILPIVIAVVASFALGFLWHGPLFGKTWLRLMGLPTEQRAPASSMVQPILLNLLGTALTAFVLAHSIDIWRPSVWGVGQDQPFYVYGFFAGFFTWIGFYVPLLLNSVAWENKSWKLFCFNATYHFVNLQLISMILAYW